MNLVVDGSLLDWSSLQTIFSVSIINLGRHCRLTFNGFWWGPFLGRKHEIARVVFNSRWPDDRRRMQFSHCAWRIHLLNYSPRSNCSFWSLLEKASGAPQHNLTLRLSSHPWIYLRRVASPSAKSLILGHRDSCSHLYQPLSMDLCHTVAWRPAISW